jgi:hypothetical protein
MVGRHRKRVIGSGITSLAVAVAMLGGTSPVSASASTSGATSPRGETMMIAPPDCYPGHVCYWRGFDQMGAAWNAKPVRSGKCRAVAGNAEGAFNGGRRAARFWEYVWHTADGETRCGGRNRLLKPGRGTSHLGFPAKGLGGA